MRSHRATWTLYSRAEEKPGPVEDRPCSTKRAGCPRFPWGGGVGLFEGCHHLAGIPNMLLCDKRELHLAPLIRRLFDRGPLAAGARWRRELAGRPFKASQFHRDTTAARSHCAFMLSLILQDAPRGFHQQPPNTSHQPQQLRESQRVWHLSPEIPESQTPTH